MGDVTKLKLVSSEPLEKFVNPAVLRRYMHGEKKKKMPERREVFATKALGAHLSVDHQDQKRSFVYLPRKGKNRLNEGEKKGLADS